MISWTTQNIQYLKYYNKCTTKQQKGNEILTWGLHNYKEKQIKRDEAMKADIHITKYMRCDMAKRNQAVWSKPGDENEVWEQDT